MSMAPNKPLKYSAILIAIISAGISLIACDEQPNGNQVQNIRVFGGPAERFGAYYLLVQPWTPSGKMTLPAGPPRAGLVEYESNEHHVTVCNNRLFVDKKYYGVLSAGDLIKVLPNAILINGKAVTRKDISSSLQRMIEISRYPNYPVGPYYVAFPSVMDLPAKWNCEYSTKYDEYRLIQEGIDLRIIEGRLILNNQSYGSIQHGDKISVLDREVYVDFDKRMPVGDYHGQNKKVEKRDHGL